MSGSAEGLTVVVSDIIEALKELVRRGVKVNEIHQDEVGVIHLSTQQ
jgi:hypothetical protein